MIITKISNIWDPQIFLHGDTYYCYATNDYAICLAVADRPTGEWKKVKNNPVLSCRSDLFGAGHNAFFVGKDGELYTSFHVQTNPNNPGEDRTTVIGRVRFFKENGELKQVIE